MKRLVISVALLLTSLCLCFFSYHLLKNISYDIDNTLSQCDEALEKDDNVKAEEKASELNILWNKRSPLFKMLVDGSFCETIENHINTISFCIIEEEYTTAKSSINDCRSTLRQILENEKLSFEIIM